MADTRIGLSGWSYAGWREIFYPEGLARRRELEYASRQFNSIEINGSFYSLQKPETYARWYEETPSDFLFALKGSRFITHNKKLKDCDVPLANFFASGLLRLGEKLGPLLWQLPASLKFDPERIDGFLDRLPRDTVAAAQLARNHDDRLRGRSWTEPGARRPVRHAIEVRNDSYRDPEFSRILRRHKVALVFSDSADWPYMEELTAGFVYLRLHGSRQTYASRYSDRELDRWAERIRTWRSGGEPEDAARITDRQPARARSRDVYVYFDNDQKANAPADARRLGERLGFGAATERAA